MELTKLTKGAVLAQVALVVCTLCAYNRFMPFEWDKEKAAANFRKHGVRLAESIPVFEDDYAITVTDDESDPNEQRFVSLGVGAKERVLVVVYGHRNQNIRIISARTAEPHEREQYEENR